MGYLFEIAGVILISVACFTEISPAAGMVVVGAYLILAGASIHGRRRRRRSR